jgi:hypothetical protein
MLMWLMEEAKGVERSLEGVARRLLVNDHLGLAQFLVEYDANAAAQATSQVQESTT